MTNISIDDMITARAEARPDFKKGGQPVRGFKGRNEIAGDAADKAAQDAEDAAFYAESDSPLETDPERAWERTYDKTLTSPKTAIQAYKNKQDALNRDSEGDRYTQMVIEDDRDTRYPMNDIGAEKPRVERTTRIPDGPEEFETLDVTELPAGKGLVDHRPDIDALIAERQ